MRGVRVLTLGFAVFGTTMLGAPPPTASVVLPATVAGLVPSGYRLLSPTCTTTRQQVRITFIAAPEYSGRQHHFNREYFASLFSYELPDGLGPMLTNAYRARMAEGIDSARRALSGLVSNALAAYERPTETSYSWGWGITQRVSHHLLGAGAQPDDVEYLGRYFGLVLTRTTVRRFRLSVRGVASSADADRWAAAVAGAMATTRLACVGP